MQTVMLVTPINPDTLSAEARAYWGGDERVGVATGPTGGWILIVPDNASQNDVDVLLGSHDPDILTPEQTIEADYRVSRDTLRVQIADRIAWHQANPVTTQNAVLVATRMQTEWVVFLRLLRWQLRNDA